MAQENSAPCPWCGGTDLKVVPDTSEEDGRIYAYHVTCRDCGANGRNSYRSGWCESEESAWEAWADRKEVVTTLPGGADRYSMLNVPVEEITAAVQAAESLKLVWYCEPGKMGYSTFHIFFDEAGKRNYQAGLYATKGEQ